MAPAPADEAGDGPRPPTDPPPAAARPAGGASVDCGEVTLHADAWGTPGGEPPLVLVHGWTGSALDWADVGPRLAAGTGAAGPRHVVAVEHRGHGRSTKLHDPARYTYDLLVEDLGRFLATLGPGPVDLLGHSMGGVIALRHALAHPAGVRSLVLMDSFVTPATLVSTDAIEALAAVGREHGMAAADAFRRAEEAAAQERRAAAGRPPRPGPRTTPARDARVTWSFANLDPEAFEALGKELSTFPALLDRLGELAMPVTVIVGEDDRGLREASDLIAAGIPGAPLVVVPGAGHSPQEDAPDAWLAAMADHLVRAASAT